MSRHPRILIYATHANRSCIVHRKIYIPKLEFARAFANAAPVQHGKQKAIAQFDFLNYGKKERDLAGLDEAQFHGVMLA